MKVLKNCDFYIQKFNQQKISRKKKVNNCAFSFIEKKTREMHARMFKKSI